MTRTEREVLACLASGPKRFGEVCMSVKRHSRTVQGALRSLANSKAIAWSGVNRHRVYQVAYVGEIAHTNTHINAHSKEVRTSLSTENNSSSRMPLKTPTQSPTQNTHMEEGEEFLNLQRREVEAMEAIARSLAALVAGRNDHATTMTAFTQVSVPSAPSVDETMVMKAIAESYKQTEEQGKVKSPGGLLDSIAEKMRGDPARVALFCGMADARAKREADRNRQIAEAKAAKALNNARYGIPA